MNLNDLILMANGKGGGIPQEVVDELTAQRDRLIAERDELTAEVERLTEQGEADEETITTLNGQIATLTDTITTLTERVEELENSAGGDSPELGTVSLATKDGFWTLWDLNTLTDGFRYRSDGVYCSFGLFEKSNIKSWDFDMPNLENGGGHVTTSSITKKFGGMFYGCTGLKSFTGDLPKLTIGRNMFYNCSGLTEWTVDLPSLTDGGSMFWGCKFTTFNVNVDSLENAQYMFVSNQIIDFGSALPSLKFGDSMFSSGAFKGEIFSIDLPELLYGYMMFYHSPSLIEFTGEMPKLLDGSNMFWLCSNLMSFQCDLPNCCLGKGMFQGCKLDKPSVKRILESLPSKTDPDFASPSTMFTNLIKNPLTSRYGLSASPSSGSVWVMTIGALRNDTTVGGKTYTGCYTDGAVDPEITQAITDAQDKGWTVSITYA